MIRAHPACHHDIPGLHEEHDGKTVSRVLRCSHGSRRCVADGFVATIMMKPLGGGSTRRVASNHCTQDAGCQPRHERHAIGRRNRRRWQFNDRFGSSRWRPRVAGRLRQALSMEPCVEQEYLLDDGKSSAGPDAVSPSLNLAAQCHRFGVAIGGRHNTPIVVNQGARNGEWIGARRYVTHCVEMQRVSVRQ